MWVETGNTQRYHLGIVLRPGDTGWMAEGSNHELANISFHLKSQLGKSVLELFSCNCTSIGVCEMILSAETCVQ